MSTLVFLSLHQIFFSPNSPPLSFLWKIGQGVAVDEGGIVGATGANHSDDLVVASPMLISAANIGVERCPTAIFGVFFSNIFEDLTKCVWLIWDCEASLDSNTTSTFNKKPLKTVAKHLLMPTLATTFSLVFATTRLSSWWAPWLRQRRCVGQSFKGSVTDRRRLWRRKKIIDGFNGSLTTASWRRRN